MALIDAFGRTIRYLRVSVTDRCNLHCDYCRRSTETIQPNHHELLTLEELARLIRIFTELGIERVRLTGGEPLLRRNLVALVQSLNGLPLLREIALSTNALLLARFAGEMKRAGLKRVNISLDSLDPGVFAAITGGGALQPVLDGIDAAVAAELNPVKINMVVMRGINDHEIPAMVEFARARGVLLRFIETMPIGEAGRDTAERFMAADAILAVIRERFGSELVPVRHARGAGPARYFRLSGTDAEVGVISARSRHFCDTCNRMRLTAKGALVFCLGRDERIELKEILRSGADDQAVQARIAEAIILKPESHLFSQPSGGDSPHHMSALGG